MKFLNIQRKIPLAYFLFVRRKINEIFFPIFSNRRIWLPHAVSYKNYRDENSSVVHMRNIILCTARALDNERRNTPPGRHGGSALWWLDRPGTCGWGGGWGGAVGRGWGGVCCNGRKFEFRECRRRRRGGSAPVLPRATSASGSPAFGTDSNGRGAGAENGSRIGRRRRDRAYSREERARLRGDVDVIRPRESRAREKSGIGEEEKRGGKKMGKKKKKERDEMRISRYSSTGRHVCA